MPYLEYILGIGLIVLTIVFTVVGVQLFLLLGELRQTVTRVNLAMDEAESRLNSVVQPLQQIGSAMTSVKASVRIFDAFAAWLNKSSKTDKDL